MSIYKPLGSLSNQNVLDIIESLDKLIEDCQKEIGKTVHGSATYSMYMAQELAYMKTRNLILSKI